MKKQLPLLIVAVAALLGVGIYFGYQSLFRTKCDGFVRADRGPAPRTDRSDQGEGRAGPRSHPGAGVDGGIAESRAASQGVLSRTEQRRARRRAIPGVPQRGQ